MKKVRIEFEISVEEGEELSICLNGKEVDFSKFHYFKHIGNTGIYSGLTYNGNPDNLFNNYKIMEKIKFEDYKEEILEALNKIPFVKKSKSNFMLIGFLDSPINEDLFSGFLEDKSTIPTVALVDKKTGQMYYFSLRILLPNLKIKDD